MSQTTLFMRDYWGQASGKQQWPQYRHRYTSLVYKPSADNANLERNAHIYRRTHWNPHVISLAGIYGLLDPQTHFTTPFWLFFPLIWCPQPNFESPMYVLPSHGKSSEGLMWRLGLQQVLKNINSVFYCPEGRVCERDEGLITAQQLCNSPPWYRTRAENLTRLAQSKDGLVFLT